MADFEVLIERAQLQRRIRELATAIAASFGDPPPVLVAVMEGARAFADALSQLLPGRPCYREVRAASYGTGTVSTGSVALHDDDALGVAGQRVLLLEDIVDTGRTVQRLCAHLRAKGAIEVRVVALLSKPSRRVVDVRLDWVGFEIPDRFVIGFGMDVGGRYRELPYIAVYDG